MDATCLLTAKLDYKQLAQLPFLQNPRAHTQPFSSMKELEGDTDLWQEVFSQQVDHNRRGGHRLTDVTAQLRASQPEVQVEALQAIEDEKHLEIGSAQHRHHVPEMLVLLGYEAPQGDGGVTMGQVLAGEGDDQLKAG